MTTDRFQGRTTAARETPFEITPARSGPSSTRPSVLSLALVLLILISAATSFRVWPHATSNAHAATTATTSTGSAENVCTTAALAAPKILTAKVAQPGDRKKQAFVFSAFYRLMPDVCDGLYRRIPRYKFAMTNPAKSNRLIKVTPYRQPVTPQGNLVADLAEVASGTYSKFPFNVPYKKRYRCAPGSRITKAFVFVHGTVVYVPERRVVAKRLIVKRRMQIPRVASPGKPRTAFRGRVKGPC